MTDEDINSLRSEILELNEYARCYVENYVAVSRENESLREKISSLHKECDLMRGRLVEKSNIICDLKWRLAKAKAQLEESAE